MDIDYYTSTELRLYIENDYRVYRNRLVPTFRNYERKWLKGSFNQELAVSGIAKNVCVDASKQYHAEFGSPGRWNDVFTPSVREECARELVEYFVAEMECGNSWLAVNA